MKELQDIYNNVKDAFYNKTEIDIEKGSVIDYYMLSISTMLEEAYKEIEENKTPYIYSSLSGEKLDDMAILFGIEREADESDKNFLYRILKWNTSNKASNYTAIETALMNMTYCSNVTYVPMVHGCGTAIAYIIPIDMTDEIKDLAIQETKSRLEKVVSSSVYIEYIIPETIDIKLNILFSIEEGLDKNNIINNINNSIVKYINGIAPGEYLELGNINKIGIEDNNVKFFSVNSLLINNEETNKISILQKTESKMMISVNNIIWTEVE